MARPFRGLADLAQLPWFEARDGRLVLADRSVGPIVDFHAHLALSYGPFGDVDLGRSHAATQRYVPDDATIDLETYANRAMDDAALGRMRVDLGARTLGRSGMRRTHTVPNLLRDMRDLGIERTVLLPIDFPIASHNSERWAEAIRGEERLVGFASVHPLDPFARRRLATMVACGARGLKLHPAVQMVPPDSVATVRLCRIAGELGIPVLFHCGPVGIEPALGRHFSQVRRYRRVVDACPRTTFILGHAGALQSDEAIAIAASHPSVYLETSGPSLASVRAIVERVRHDRVLFGSDWPFHSEAVPLAKVLLATEGAPRARRAILFDNAAELLGIQRHLPRTTARERDAPHPPL